MKKTIIQYNCPTCKKSYQLSDLVEIINPFGWQKPTLDKSRICRACRG